MAMQPLQLTPLLSTTTGFLVLFIGKRLNLEIPFLRRFSIPEPVSGGLLVAVLLSLVHLIGARKSASILIPAIFCWCTSSRLWG